MLSYASFSATSTTECTDDPWLLASTPDPGNLNDIALLADKIMEVAILYSAVAAINTNSEPEHLRKEVDKF